MNEQISSGIRSGLKVVGAMLAAHGYTKYSTIMNGEDMIGFALMVAGFFWSYVHHKNARKNTPTITNP